MILRFFTVVTLVFAIFFSTFGYLYASGDVLGGLAYHIVLSVPAPDGTLISLENGRYVLTSKSYDLNLAGVITTHPRLELDFLGKEGSVAIVKSGENLVRVTSVNGPIAVGDWLSGSDIPGVAMKMTRSGMSIGQALAAHDTEGESLIPVAISIQFYNSSLGDQGLKQTDVMRESFFDLLSVFKTASKVPAPQAFRYILAALLLLFAVLFGFFTFGRVASRGIEAIGRNPLAKNTILMGLIINVIVSLAVIFAGLVAAYYVIKL